MIQTTIERTDVNGREVTVPADVLADIEEANAYLMVRLKPADYLPIQVKWHRFVNPGTWEWTVELHLEYEGMSADHRFTVEQLRDARQMKEQIGEVVWAFSEVLSTWVGNSLRRMREERNQLTAEGKE